MRKVRWAVLWGGQRSTAQSSDLPYLFWRRSAHVLHNYALHLERQCSFNEPHCDGGSDRQNRHHGNTFKYVRPFGQSGRKGWEWHRYNRMIETGWYVDGQCTSWGFYPHVLSITWSEAEYVLGVHVNGTHISWDHTSLSVGLLITCPCPMNGLLFF